jgi:hypothetical protein
MHFVRFYAREPFKFSLKNLKSKSFALLQDSSDYSTGKFISECKVVQIRGLGGLRSKFGMSLDQRLGWYKQSSKIGC